MKAAVVGTGSAGLAAAYALSRTHEAELFEALPRPGGHARTVDVDGLRLDTGFIVHNEPNYPELGRLFRELGVATQPSEMSFSMTCGCGLAWSSRRPWRAGPGLLREILRFLRTAGDADAEGKSFDAFLRDEGYSDSFRWHYLVPMTSAIWSTAPGAAMLEAIGLAEYETFFAACDRLLAPDGLVAIQVIGIPDERFERYRRTPDWIQQVIFPGSLLPSLEVLARAVARTRLMIVGLEEIGIFYARTLREWRQRFLRHIEQVRALGYDERFERTWTYYLTFCEAAFALRALRDMQLVLTRPYNDALPSTPVLRPSLL